MEAFHPQRRRACRHGRWRAGTVFHARRAIAAASSHRSALHDRGECLRHSPVAQFRQFLVIVQIGSAHGHPFQSAGFFRFAPASLFDSYRRSFVTRPLSSAADHRGDIENIVRFVTSNDGVGAEDGILARDTPASCSSRSGGSPRPASCRLAPRSLIARPRCSRPAGRGRGWAGWRVADPLTGRKTPTERWAPPPERCARSKRDRCR